MSSLAASPRFFHTIALYGSLTVLSGATDSYWWGIAAFLALLVGHVAINVHAIWAGSSAPIVLESLPLSHYVEKVRIALDWSGLPYVEEGHHAVLGVMLSGRTVPTLRVGRSTIQESSDVLAFLHGRWPERFPFLAPSAEDARWQTLLDDELGPHLRRYMYFHLMTMDDTSLARRLWGTRIQPWQRFLQPLGLFHVARFFLFRLLRISARGAESSLARVEAVLAQVNDALKDGRQWLCGGDKPTVADLTLCALGSYCVISEHDRTLKPRMEELPVVVRESVLRWRKMPAGKLVLRFYEQCRYANPWAEII